MPGKLLTVVTSADQYEKVGYRTGLWLSELIHFIDVAEEAGYQCDIASPSGGKVPIDPESLILSEIASTMHMGGEVSKRYQDRAFMDRLNATRKIADVTPDYGAIYMAGGHGVMFDFPDNTALAALTAEFFGAGKVVSAVCHGPAGLLNVKLRSGERLLKGRKATGFSWREEVAAHRDHAVPFSLEEELKKRGAEYSKALLPLNAHVVEDGLLITGQNPASAKGVAKAVVKKLDEIEEKTRSRLSA
jgi:putative intracellular protease/amidase